jgi:hypothetical protein
MCGQYTYHSRKEALSIDPKDVDTGIKVIKAQQ